MKIEMSIGVLYFDTIIKNDRGFYFLFNLRAKIYKIVFFEEFSECRYEASKDVIIEVADENCEIRTWWTDHGQWKL